MLEPAQSGEKIFRGIPVSPGVCRGRLLVLERPQDGRISPHQVKESELQCEVGRLEQAIIDTRHEILEVQRKVSEGLGAQDAGIFDAHLLVLEDPTLIEEVSRMIFEEKVTAEYAFKKVADKYAQTLSAIDDEYLRERASDMRDVTERILNHLTGQAPRVDLSHLEQPCIIISHDLTPSCTALLDKKHVLGFGTDVGSQTSHTAIMARSMRIPAVVGLENASVAMKSGDYALLDGFNGLIIINPTDQTLFEYGQLVRKHVTLEEKLREVHDKPAVTLDGARIVLSANVEQAADAEAVLASGAEGVGLFRTEYLFINRDTLPGEEEQYEAYRQVAAALKPNPVIIRTLDLGGDKFLSQLQVPTEMNPFLGWRAIRFCLQQKDIFRVQLRAILRASTETNIKMMYPMISCLDELLQANNLLEEYKRELDGEGIPFNRNIDVGAMIEIPSAALAADVLARRVRFFSIGTNDLIQYSLAVDRLNERIAHLYEPTHPAILRLIKMTADAAHKAGIWVGVCGEMAGDPIMTPLLLGLGMDELSAAPPHIPSIKHLIRRMKITEAQELAEFALQCESGAEILARSTAFVEKIAPSLFDTPRPRQAS
ncbi:MAG: phosphoenolpyruvate--protein phosphotransferase [Verrucomicrobia subdivision 3 bacterium]|nr:phosphoenolpyruvate--protein phosphotransferase [Limisphaerales bacterium]